MNNEKPIPVVMCTYQRLERLSTTLDQLVRQEDCNIKLYIWNNNVDDADFIEKTIKEYRQLEIELYNSKINIGGFGRFYYARKLSDKYPTVIFIDDDVELAPNSLSTLAKEYSPNTIHSFYAYRFKTRKDYFKRVNLDPRDEADYCGTGGMICDTSIFKHEDLFKCPKQYWFIEDLWLSYYANHILGWKLYKSGSTIKIIHDNKDQWQMLAKTKTEFLGYLVDQGWDIIKPNILRRIKLKSKLT